MGSSRKRSLDRSNHRQLDLLENEASAKRIKTASISSPGSKKSSLVKNKLIPDTGIDYEPPKSKKELRALKKAARKQKEAEEQDDVHSDNEEKFLSKEEYKQQKQREKKEQRKAMMQELRKQERENKKIRQQKRLNREHNAPKRKQLQTEATTTTTDPKLHRKVEKKTKKKTKKQSSQQEEKDMTMKALKQVLRGSTDESGMTTTTLGVKYKDIVVGTGDEVREKKLVTVQYQLKGGKFMAVLDSSKKFNFRVGKGEVIQGWDIGLVGMRVGGRRQLIVPPKAGYGSQDIGAGPGGLLYFDISLLAIR